MDTKRKGKSVRFAFMFVCFRYYGRIMCVCVCMRVFNLNRLTDAKCKCALCVRAKAVRLSFLIWIIDSNHIQIDIAEL